VSLGVTIRGDGVRIAVHVKPRSSRSKIEGVREDGSLTVALSSPPVDGAANAELLKLLAKAIGVRKSALCIATGATGRRKLVDVEGIDEITLRARLSSLVASDA
jgi:uncharacterized protein (TIGR00251 family)